jgi:hypothetical protein
VELLRIICAFEEISLVFSFRYFGDFQTGLLVKKISLNYAPNEVVKLFLLGSSRLC